MCAFFRMVGECEHTQWFAREVEREERVARYQREFREEVQALSVILEINAHRAAHVVEAWQREYNVA